MSSHSSFENSFLKSSINIGLISSASIPILSSVEIAHATKLVV